MTKIEKIKYLIIGNSAGGIAAAEAIRETDKHGTLGIISDEPYPAYSRPLISEYLAKRCSLERMLFRPADFYEKNNITTFLGKKVDRINIDEHVVELASGEIVGWDKLLLATGGSPIFPRIEGAAAEGVFTFTTLDDAKAIDQFLDGRSQAVVIGGGLIGTSVTEALVKRGVAVTMVEMKNSILNTILDEEASALVEATLQNSNVDIISGHTAVKINAEAGAVSSITLDDGSIIPCQLVIVAIGVQPNIELVSSTGIKVNRGVAVDHHMATTTPDIYACGDVAEAYDFIYGGNRVTPIWPNAYIGGRIAGLNMAGIPTDYQGGTAMNSLKYFGMDVVSAGMVNAPDDSYDVISEKHGSTYHKVILKDGFLAGMVFAGNIEKSGIIFNLMKDMVNADSFKAALVTADFGLASLPEEIWRPHLELKTEEAALPAI